MYQTPPALSSTLGLRFPYVARNLATDLMNDQVGHAVGMQRCQSHVTDLIDIIDGNKLAVGGCRNFCREEIQPAHLLNVFRDRDERAKTMRDDISLRHHRIHVCLIVPPAREHLTEDEEHPVPAFLSIENYRLYFFLKKIFVVLVMLS